MQELRQKRENEAEELRGKLQDVTRQLENLEISMKKLTAGIQQVI